MRCAYHSTARITLQAHIMVCAHFILRFHFQDLDLEYFAFFAHFMLRCAFHSAYHFRRALHSPFSFSGLRIFLIQCAYHCRCAYHAVHITVGACAHIILRTLCAKNSKYFFLLYLQMLWVL